MIRSTTAVTQFFLCWVIAFTKGLPDQVFWDNDWPSDLTKVGGPDDNDNDDDFTFPPSTGLENPNIISGQENLNKIKDDEDAVYLTDVINNTPNQEVEVRTWNGSWIRNIYLPNDTQIENLSKFQLTVTSTWYVNVHYNSGNVVKIENGEKLILALINGVWLNEDEYNVIATPSPTRSPTRADENNSPNLLEGTVLFAQSQIIPSKHRHEGDDTQPHLTAMRKTLVMFQPNTSTFVDKETSITMTVHNKDGNIVDDTIIMHTPENIPKHESWIDLGDGVDIDDIEFPSSLTNPHVIQGQSNLNTIGNDEDAVGLTTLLNNNNREVEIRTADGSWVKNVYFPKGSTVPQDSKIQLSCNSSYKVYIHYPKVDGEEWRIKSYSRGDTEIAILVNGIWIAENDLEHNAYIFGHGFYTTTLDREWVQSGMTLEFSTMDNNEEYAGKLDDIDIGAPTELMISTLDAGFLTEPRNQFTFKDDLTTHREYFETAPLSRLIVVQYETMHLTEIMLPDGTFYKDVSNDDGGWHSGDMRQYIGKILLSHGIDLANYGINSSNGSSESSHPFTCALLAAHNTVGLYQNGRIVHGGSGGNGMITLDASTGNEFSHEVGHNYGLGHYVDGFKGSVHRHASEINSSWGWDSEANVFIPNFSQPNSGKDRCLDGECQSPFLGKYQYGTDSMAGGSPNYSNKYTLYTPNTSRIIQNFLEKRAVWDSTSSTGFRKFHPSTKQMEEFTNNANGQKVPRLYRVPVTTIVGFYNPDLDRDLQSYIYPAMHGAYGFVYNDDGNSGNDNDGCKLVVETKSNIDTPLVYSLSASAHQSNQMNKFHVNVPTEDEPYEASIYCWGELLDSRTLDGPKEDEPSLEYTVTGAPISDPPFTATPTSSPITTSATPTSSPTTESPTTNPTLSICFDNPSYKINGNKKKNCNWVNTKKCKKMNDVTKDACPIACKNNANCTLPKCWKNIDWKPKKGNFNNCKSITKMNKKNKKKACASIGIDKKTFGYQACSSCKKCKK